MILADIWLGYLIPLELIDDPIVSRMVKVSVINYQVMEEHDFARRVTTFQLLLSYLWQL